MAGAGGQQTRVEMLLAELLAAIRERPISAPAAATAAAVESEILNAIPIPVNPGAGEERAIATAFSKRKPMTFDGTGEPEIADDWIMDMERIFRSLQCTEPLKVTLATDTLKGNAQRWWVQEIGQGIPTTWDEFLVRFRKKYFIRAFQSRKQRELANLKQGDMSVHEYETKFTGLLRFAGALVPNDEEKARRFQEGLRDNIRGRVATHMLVDYGLVVETATMDIGCFSLSLSLIYIRAGVGCYSQCQ